MSRAAINLVSVNTAPDRAKKVIGQVIELVKDRYSIVHAGNSESECDNHDSIGFRTHSDSTSCSSVFAAIEGVAPLLRSIQPPPGILFCASMWTPEQQEQIQQIARDTVPGIKTHAIPTGLQVQVGPQGIVDYLVERVPAIMES